ncbi:MAG TPA: ATP-binding cassette domain-containing protein, partial [Candidatus Limnocylindria bacterium]
MPPQFIYTMYGLKKIAPGTQREILKGITLAFYPTAKIGVLGPNGAGKSTLLRIMAGIDKEYVGDARITEGYRAGLLAQEPQLDASKDVRGNVEEGVADRRAVLKRYEELSAKFGEPLSDADMDKLNVDFQKAQDEIEAKGLWDLDSQIDHAMDALRLPPAEQDVTTLSGGERRRVALCRLLLAHPDLLLLDEPTNHLDAESVAWLERTLTSYDGCVVAVTHDRYFLDNAASWILELDKGAGIPYEGNYSSWLDQKRKRLADEEKQESARQRTLARELEWVQASPRARQAKSKARIESYERLLAESPDE